MSTASRIVCLSIAACLLVAGAAVAIATVTHDPTPAPKLTLSARGTISISDSTDGEAILTGLNLAPGTVANGAVTITNTGTAPGALSLTASEITDTLGHDGGVLSRELELEVSDVTGGSHAAVFIGPLAEMPTQELATVQAAAARTYRFSIALPDTGAPVYDWSEDNRFQASGSQFAFTWTLTGDGSIPVAPVDPDEPAGPVPPRDAGATTPLACGAELLGDAQDNLLVGTERSDRADGLGGRDQISAYGGEDCAYGGAGADSIDGGSGADRLVGGPGADVINAGAGDDWIRVNGAGTDTVFCGNGDDHLRAGPRDLLHGC